MRTYKVSRVFYLPTHVDKYLSTSVQFTAKKKYKTDLFTKNISIYYHVWRWILFAFSWEFCFHVASIKTIEAKRCLSADCIWSRGKRKNNLHSKSGMIMFRCYRSPVLIIEKPRLSVFRLIFFFFLPCRCHGCGTNTWHHHATCK